MTTPTLEGLAATSDLDEFGKWLITGIYHNTNASPNDDLFKSAVVTLEVSSDSYNAP